MDEDGMVVDEVGGKRTAEGGGEGDAKKARTSGAMVVSETPQSQLSTYVQSGEKRTSSLLAPTMLLTGHKAATYTVKFHPKGDALASGSFDKDIFLWDVHGECKNYNVLSGHKNAVLQLEWTHDGSKIVSASADKTVAIWDANSGKRIKKCQGHTAVVNTVAVPGAKGPAIFGSSGDDGCLKIWDFRKRGAIQEFTHTYQILAVAFSEDASKLYAAGIDNNILVYDIKKHDIVETYKGHTDSITGLALSPDGKFLLSNSMDKTARIWDIKPFVSGDRNIKTFQGATHGSDKNLLRCAWSPDGEMVTVGSADRAVHVWDVPSTQELYFLPGHKGTVNEVVFHPTEPIVASGSSDKTIYLGELS